MKKYFLSSMVTVLATIQIVTGQSSWTQKANFGGGTLTEARAFSIGNFGYFGGPTAVLWRYDPSSDSWSQMAAFPGATRLSPVAFSIGTKGYLGTGGNFNDFYEYDALANTWTQKANFGGSGREGALGISINGKGYIGTGGGYLKDWWEFDTTSNAWTQKANLTGPTRYHGGAFTVGNKGYVCTGFNGSFFNDLWEFDPVTNMWTARASLPAATRDRPVGLGTLTKGYILTGWTGSIALNDAWEYDPPTDTWTQLPSMPTAGRYNSCGFVLGNKLYIGTGYMNGTVSDFWQYGPDCISASVSQPVSCFGICDGTTEVTLPDPGAVSGYLWSNGATSALVQNLCSGTYTVSVTDTTGCISISTVNVSSPDEITASASVIEPDCFGDTNGTLCVIPSISPSTYVWANGDTSACLMNIAAGVYTVTVTDTSGCEGVVPLTLTQPAEIILNINSVNATCSTCANGTASAQTTGGTAPLTYSWSTGSGLAFINNLLPGVYTCCVTDANNCTVCDSVVVGYPVGISEVNIENVLVGPNPFSNSIHIDFSIKSAKKAEVKLLDITGKAIHTQIEYGADRIQIFTGHIYPGIYILELRINNTVKHFKLIKGG